MKKLIGVSGSNCTALFEEVDGLLFETFYYLEELKTVLQIVRKETNLPIIAQVSMHEPGVLQDDTPLPKALNIRERYGADVVGVNCLLGPYHMTRALEAVPLPKKAVLSAYPNASLIVSFHNFFFVITPAGMDGLARPQRSLDQGGWPSSPRKASHFQEPICLDKNNEPIFQIREISGNHKIKICIDG